MRSTMVRGKVTCFAIEPPVADRDYRRNDRRFGQMTVFRNVIARLGVTLNGKALAGGVSVALRRSVSADRGCSGSADRV